MTDTSLEGPERGREARQGAPRSSHAEYAPASGRPDPVDLLDEQNRTRLQWLVPIRHGRMCASPFAFYRGAARVMAADLAHTPTSGIEVQIGGDAHLSNFGAYASPERRLVFDANDFDETLRGPWEWDLKRLVTSFMIAGRHRSLPKRTCRQITDQVTRAYRDSMAGYASRGLLEVWYDHATIDDIRATLGRDPESLRRLDRFERRARARTSLQALAKLTVEEDGRRRIRADPPVLYPLRDLPDEHDPEALEAAVRDALEHYKSTLADDRRWLLDQYRPIDIGLKVVGVGSVGTRCAIILLEGRGAADPLFLQAKEAGPSVLEEHLGPSPYDNCGRRVVEGQRMVQAESDIFLGWTAGREGRDFYLRQLRDWKGSVDIDKADAAVLSAYASLCGHTLARGHARSGDPGAIAAYIGASDRFVSAITTFAERYASQNAEDFAAFRQAIADGRIPAEQDGAERAKGAALSAV